MKFVTLDFETYYDKEYSLSKMTTEEYINDPRFETIGYSIQIEDDDPTWHTGDDAFIKKSLGSQSWWDDVILIAQNTVFDGAILAWRYGLRPAFYIDTLSMARPFHNANVGVGLAKLVEFYALGAKGKEVVAALGKRRADFSIDELAAYGGYCRNDVDLTWRLYHVLQERVPKAEMKLIDLTLRMYITPSLCLDRELIEQELDNEIERKEKLMEQLDCDQEMLSSNAKFAGFLTQLGVDPPMKKNAKGKFIPAFAKSDADFVALLDHEDVMVQAAVEARLGVKSTQKESRARRFLGIHDRMGGKLPVALGYYNAHTGRYGAFDSQNLQNLPRVDKKNPRSGLLRKAIMAPPGHKLVVADLSQIEARMLVWQAGQEDKIEAFAQKRDVYSEQASVIYGRPVDRKKVADDFLPGFIGKCVTLGCGYGLGYPKFGGMIYVGMLGGEGILFGDDYVETLDTDPFSYAARLSLKMAERVEAVRPAAIDEDTWYKHMSVAQKIIKQYRDDNPKVVKYWDVAHDAITAMFNGEEMEFGGPTGDLLKVEKNRIWLPNGMPQLYEGLEVRDGEYSFLRRKERRVQRVRVYGGALVENLTQALARIVITDVMRKADKHGYRVALQVHDEVVLVVPEDEADEAYTNVLGWMREPPKWAPGLPLDAEGGVEQRYGNAK